MAFIAAGQLYEAVYRLAPSPLTTPLPAYCLGVALGAWTLVKARALSAESESAESDGGVAWYLTRWAAFAAAAGWTVLTAWAGHAGGWSSLHAIELLPALPCWVVAAVPGRNDGRPRFIHLGHALAMALAIVLCTAAGTTGSRARRTASRPQSPATSSTREVSAIPAEPGRKPVSPVRHRPVEYEVAIGDEVIGRAKDPPAPVPAPPAPPPPVLAPAAVPPSGAACLEFCRRLEGTLGAGDASELDSAFDLDALTARALAGLRLTPGTVAAAREQVGHGVSQVLQDLTQVLRHGDGFKLLRVEDSPTGRRATFRLLFQDGTFSYHGLVVHAGAGGAVRVVDLYDFALGDLLSRTWRRLLVPKLIASAPGGVERLDASDRELVTHADALREMGRQLRAARGAEVVAIYRRLPESLRQERAVLLMYLQASAGMGERALEEAMQRYQAAYPGDPGADLWLVDYHSAAKNYGLLLLALDRVDQRIGGDPYLRARKALAYLATNDVERASEWAGRAAGAEPALREANLALLRVALRRRHFTEATRLLATLEGDRLAAAPGMSDDPDFAAFARSREYRAWSAGRERKSKAAAEPRPAHWPSGEAGGGSRGGEPFSIGGPDDVVRASRSSSSEPPSNRSKDLLEDPSLLLDRELHFEQLSVGGIRFGGAPSEAVAERVVAVYDASSDLNPVTPQKQTNGQLLSLERKRQQLDHLRNGSFTTRQGAAYMVERGRVVAVEFTSGPVLFSAALRKEDGIEQRLGKADQVQQEQVGDESRATYRFRGGRLVLKYQAGKLESVRICR